MEGNTTVPVWPVDIGNGLRRMIFLFGEPRWYLWFKDENHHAIAALRRDLLMLHQNGDLELPKEVSVGSYVTALHDGKMIRGRVSAPKNKPNASDKNDSKTVTVIDIDEGKAYQVPTSQVRVIPLELRNLPCQAIRCDIGLDCLEQFDWPTQLNDMLHKALDNAVIFVENSANRPGSIPTILAKITVCNPATGQSMSIHQWLLEIFSSHLDLCSMEKYKPFPVGMSADLMVRAMGFQQQQILGFSSQGATSVTNMVSNMSPSLPSCSPATRQRNGPGATPITNMVSNMSPSLPLCNPASMQRNMPGSIPGNMTGVMPSNMTGVMPGNMTREMPVNRSVCMPVGIPGNVPGNVPVSMPGNVLGNRPTGIQGNMAASMPVGMQGTVPGIQSRVPFSVPGNMHGTTFQMPMGMMPSFPSNVPSAFPLPQQSFPSAGPSPHVIPHHGFVRHGEAPYIPPTPSSFTTSATRSTFPVANPSVSPRSLFGEDSVRIKEMSSSSSSISSAGCLSPIRIESDSAVGYENSSSIINHPVSMTSKARSDASSSDSQLSCGRGTRRKLKTDTSSTKSSSLSVDAAPFVPRFCVPQSNENIVGSKKIKDSTENQDSLVNRESKPPIFQAKPDTCGAKTKQTDHSQIKSEPSKSTEDKLMSESCSSSGFPTGRNVELVHIVRNWKVGQVLRAFMAKVWNPSCFEVNVVDEYASLLSSIQEEMHVYYGLHRLNISSKQEAKDLCGDFCACFDPDDNLWFRAEVEDWNMDDSVIPLKVWAVDYGGCSRIDVGSIQPLSTKLACTSPVLVTICSMKNIKARSDNDIWPEAHLNKVKELLPEDKTLYLRIDGAVTEEHIWPVSVFSEPSCAMQSVNEILVAEGCAHYIGYAPILNNDHTSDELYEDTEDPMEEAFKIGGNNYDIDDEDAVVAISGRKFNEEIGICWFYNKHGYCYKNFCDLKHIRLERDGRSMDQVALYTRSFEDIQDGFLAPGRRLKLTVTCILTVHHFIARIHLSKGTLGIQSRETLSSVLKHLNSKEMKRSLKAFTELPADGEIVLYKDEAGTFYRGRIVGSSVEDEDDYYVLNVDTGYKQNVALKNLRKVDPAFLHHPFESVECWLADMAPTQTDREWVKTCNAIFADLVRREKLTATIIRSAPWGIEVNITNQAGQDLAIVLKDMGILKSSPMRHFPEQNSKYLPG